MPEVASFAAQRQATNLYFGFVGMPEKTHTHTYIYMYILWEEPMNWASSSFYVTATTSNPGNISPYEVWHGRPIKPNLRHVLAPGTYHLKRDGKSKDQGRAGFRVDPNPELSYRHRANTGPEVPGSST